MRALIVGNGEPPSRELFEALRREAPDLLLCADGGADTVRRHGAEPDMVVGDLDSETPPGPGVAQRVRIDAENTGTDLNKALAWAEGQGVTTAILTGVTGRRTDHTLWNLSLLRTYGEGMALSIVDDHCRIWRLPAGSAARIEAEPGRLISLSPLDGPARGIRTENLRWPLDGEDLVPGERDGISNEVVEAPARVRFAGPGELLLIVQTEGDVTGGATVTFE